MATEKDTNKYKCERCNKVLSAVKFYTYKDGTKVEKCKDCLCAHVNNFDPETFIWLLEKMDVPYIPDEWNNIRDKEYAKDANKGMAGPVVFGRYLAKMKLKQYVNPETGKPYCFADSEKLQQEHRERLGKPEMTEEEKKELRERDEMLKKQFMDGEISEAEYKTLVSTESQVKQREEVAAFLSFPGAENAANLQPAIEDQYMSEDELPDPAAELTQEDKIYLAMKWGRLYKPNEWITLERKYTEMMNSFDIQDADSINTLILMCKTDLKANQALDIGDIDGYQKLARVSDSLRKSGKFTAAQNKEKDNGQINCTGQLVAFCEREGGFIPKFVTDAPQDIIDKIVKDQKNYLYNLVTQDLGFGQQIENYLKKIELEKEKQQKDENLEDPEEIMDDEIAAYYRKVAEEKQLDAELDEKSNAYDRLKESDNNGVS